jgi:hypothetical protein
MSIPTANVFIHVEEVECVEPAARFQVKPLLYLPKGRKHRNDQRKKSFWHESILSPLPVPERRRGNLSREALSFYEYTAT